MIASEVHQLQRRLDSAESNLSATRGDIAAEIGNRPPPIGMSDWEYLDSHPEVRKIKAQIEELRPQVEQGQAEVGGVVYRIPAWRVEDLQKKIEKITRRAAKLEVEPPRLTITGEIENEKVYVERATGRRVGEKAGADDPRFEVQIREWSYVAVAGTAPKLAGWAFIATLQHEEAGTVIRRIPGIRAMVQNIIQTPDEKHANEEMERRFDLTQYREAGPVCDHCHTRRARKDTYIVVHLETGEFKQVGSNCLADFLGGLSPQAAAKGFEYIMSVLDQVGALEDEDEGFRGFRAEPMEGTLEYLTHVALMVRLNGWTPRSKAEYGGATADQAAENLDCRKRRVKVKGAPAWIDPEDEDIETAKAALAYVREELEGNNDFEHNLKVTLAGEYVKTRGFGIAAAGILTYCRHIEREVAKKVEEERKADALNEHYGQIKDRVELTLTVTKIFEHQREDGWGVIEGVTYITTLVDAAGRTFKWFGSRPLDRGITYQGRWTVKGHEDWQGTKETVINRPHGLVEVTEQQEQIRISA